MNEKGFSLLEVMLSIFIIGSVGALFVSFLLPVMEREKDVQDQMRSVFQIANTLELYSAADEKVAGQYADSRSLIYATRTFSEPQNNTSFSESRITEENTANSFFLIKQEAQ